ncbi:hypothetical protein QJS10_CPA10g01220 [Acorus calamus]|uniref:Uncharacterized protein n=1 Tax=Acorus calamus TaxID=4465 RepID=A0AAV9DYX8_ACOCL|nr:hypothetical protein QJS10_CPA10g01220 [Acorus calamus]
MQTGVVVLPSSPSSGFCSPDYKFLSQASDSRPGVSKSLSSVFLPKIGIRVCSCRLRSFKVRASEGSDEIQTPVAPLQFESPSGQLLSQIMQTHPHLLPTAIDQQIEQLKTERDAQKGEVPSTPQDILLRRIAEVKEKERQRALEEILYSLIVQKFIDSGISMIPAISSSSDPADIVDSWPKQEQKLESVHSPDALEMIQSHLSLIFGDRMVGPLSSSIHISKVKLGKLYAASIMYGYFVKRVDQRFQLERSMKTLPTDMNEGKFIEEDSPYNPFWDLESMVQISPDEDGYGEGVLSDSGDNKSYKLRSYVMNLANTENLQRYATVRSKEGISLIEKQTQALFGRPDIRIAEDGSLDASNDSVVQITCSGLSLLVLEAVAFGAFLWDAEGYVESKYHFVNN